jgi:hypothetical protein
MRVGMFAAWDKAKPDIVNYKRLKHGGGQTYGHSSD